jgi:hypothetical protein
MVRIQAQGRCFLQDQARIRAHEWTIGNDGCWWNRYPKHHQRTRIPLHLKRWIAIGGRHSLV